VLQEVLELALGRRGYTHERVDDLKSILFPQILKIDGRPLDQEDQDRWGKGGWRDSSSQSTNNNQNEGVGGIAGIWHSEKAGKKSLSEIFFKGNYLI
jgi:hypothetical protein